VSVGETRAAEPLVHALLEQYPGHRVLLTHMTPTGRTTSTALYKDPRILIAYVPYDLTNAVDRFLARVQPQLGLLMETEIWPNLILRSRAHQVPMLLINARMSARSGRRYARFDKLIRPVLSALSAVGAQTQDDADRLTHLGAQNVSVTGNLKFDVRIDPALQMLGQQWRRDIQTQQTRPIWLAASTREGEEAVILAAHRALCALLPDQHPLLVLVPRHPQRFNDIAQLIAREGFTLARRNAGLPTAETDVWLGDSMGEMVAYYSLANVAVIGGTLLPFGGQNLIEAAACGTPLIIGPHTYNFSAAATAAAQTGAAIRIDTVTPETLANALHALIDNPTQHEAATKAAACFVSSATGATNKLLALITRYSRP
jgi:3-deoxy-D-manno-octulosonic-acid transferase